MSARTPDLARRERRVLLTCARRDLDVGGVASVRDLAAEELDWEAVAFHARLHSVGPLLHRHLSAIERIPHQAGQRLLALRHRAAYRNRFYFRENAELVDAFSRAGARVIVPKGIALVELVYRDLGLRPLIDLAFMVHPNDLSAAEGTLLERGYWPRPAPRMRSAWRWCCPHAWYSRAAAIKFSVVLHTGLAMWPHRHRLTPDVLWSRAQNASIGGTEAVVLGPMDQLICLCLQADCTGYFNRAAVGKLDAEELIFAPWTSNRLIRFTDIHETLRHYRDAIDWERLLALARAAGLEEALGRSLGLTTCLLDTQIPSGALRYLPPAQQSGLRRRLFTAVQAAARRPTRPGALALTWNRLGPRRQLELIRLIGLVELAFPSMTTLRADHGQRSRLALVALRLRQAAKVLTRSACEWLWPATRRALHSHRQTTPR